MESEDSLRVGSTVHFRKCKWPDRLVMTRDVEVVAVDRYGLWVASDAGAAFRYVDSEPWLADVASVGCIREGVTWTTWFFSEPRKNIYLDVVHRSSLQGDTFEFVDLDLDVYGLDAIEIVDVEELETNSRLLGYPEELVAEAWASAKAALADARAGGRLYEIGWSRLEAFLGRPREVGG